MFKEREALGGKKLDLCCIFSLGKKGLNAAARTQRGAALACLSKGKGGTPVMQHSDRK